MLLQMVLFPFSFCLDTIPLYMYIHLLYPFIHLWILRLLPRNTFILKLTTTKKVFIFTQEETRSKQHTHTKKKMVILFTIKFTKFASI